MIIIWTNELEYTHRHIQAHAQACTHAHMHTHTHTRRQTQLQWATRQWNCITTISRPARLTG